MTWFDCSRGPSFSPANFEGANVMHVAVTLGDAAMVALFLTVGKDVGLTRRVIASFGFSPLHLALQRGHENIAEMLLEADPSPTSMVDNIDGWTALHYAIHRNASVKLVERLYRANPQALFVEDRTRTSPLLLLLHRERTDAMFEALIYRVSWEEITHCASVRTTADFTSSPSACVAHCRNFMRELCEQALALPLNRDVLTIIFTCLG